MMTFKIKRMYAATFPELMFELNNIVNLLTL